MATLSMETEALENLLSTSTAKMDTNLNTTLTAADIWVK